MKKIISLLLITVFIIPHAVLAATINPNNIISTEQLLDYRSMSTARIQKFLENKSSGLSGMKFNVFGQSKTAAQIIYDAANYYKINPEYILTLLQKEQSLITTTIPKQSQIDWATGYGCPDGRPCDPQYRGFFNQINWSTKRIVGDWYLGGIEKNGRTISGWGPGITKTTLDGIKVTPENSATAVLYTYTPWVGKYGGGDQRWGGATLTGKLWQDWFVTNYPDGSLLQAAGRPGVYLIKNGKRRAFWSQSAFLANYNKKNIITVSQSELDAYEDGPPIRFPQYSLLQSPAGKIYLLDGIYKREIESNEIFRKIGFNPEEIIPVEDSDLNSYENGKPITMDSIYPTGILLQSKQTGGVSFIQNGVRHPIWSKEILVSRFPSYNLTLVDDSEINSFRPGDPLTFRDSEIITSPGTRAVYVISNGQRRRITSSDVFNSLGYKWENIVYTSDAALMLHPEGAPLTLQ